MADEEFGPEINNIGFSFEDFVEVVRELSDISSPGPNGVPAILLTRFGEALVKPFWLLLYVVVEFRKGSAETKDWENNTHIQMGRQICP